jgi:hypothetical protein
VTIACLLAMQVATTREETAMSYYVPSLTFLKEANLEVDADIDVRAHIDPHVDGNHALANATADAIGNDTFTDAESSTLVVEDHSSHSAASSISFAP